MAKFVSNNGRISVISDNVNINDTLPLGTYYISFDPISGFYLSQTENIQLKTKIYGEKTGIRTSRIINTFKDRVDNTGVLLSGIKGSGKSLQIKHISEVLRNEHGISSLIVNTNMPIDALTLFLNEITEPIVVILDEFEKTFEKMEEQKQFLTLLDGISFNKKLYLFSCNDVEKITEFMLARPSRIYYHYRYTTMDKEAVVGYCEDFLKNKKFIENIIAIHDFMGNTFNFDILQSLIQESNRYDESPLDIINILNIKDNSNQRYRYRDFTYKMEFTDNHYSSIEDDIKDGKFVSIDMEEFYHGKTMRIDSFIPSVTKKDYENLKEKYKKVQQVQFSTQNFNEKDNLFDVNVRVFFTIRDVVQKCGDTFNIRISDLKITLTESTNIDMWHLVV